MRWGDDQKRMVTPRGLRPVLFVRGGGHLRRAAAVEDRYGFGAAKPGLGGGVDGGVAAADHDDAAADGQSGFVGRLAEPGDEGDGVLHAGQGFAGNAGLVGGGLAEGEEDGVVVAAQGGEVQGFAEALVVVEGNTAEAEDEGYFAGGEVVRQFVRGDAVFVEAAGFGFGVEHVRLVAEAREGVGAGEAGGAGADDGDAAAGCRRAGEGLAALRHLPVGGDALQRADGDGFVGLRLADAGALAQNLGGGRRGRRRRRKCSRQGSCRRRRQGCRWRCHG